ncbi:sulfatase [Planctomycetaceae bacterium SH139]
MKFWLPTYIFAFLVALPTSKAAEPPNILFIYLDDFGWRDAGFMGSDFYETPHLDRLAASGMVFSDAYACAANCAPARASLMSGQYSPRHKIFNVGTKPRGKAKFRRLEHLPGTDTLAPEVITFAHRLQQQGYRTATIGKWHLSDDPTGYGFHENIAGNHSGSPPRGYFPPHPNAAGLATAAADEYLTDRLTDEALGFIDRHHDQRWALYLPHFAVHTPLQAKPELLAKFERKPKGKLHSHAVMAAMIAAVDEGVGRILAKLDALGLRKNTLIIFSSDNGGYGPATDMHPLKGYKGTYYEGGIRVPLVVSWPGVVEPGAASSVPVSGVDIYPTLCEIAEAPASDQQSLDGISLVPVLKGESGELSERALFWHFPAYLESYAVSGEQRDPLFRSRPCSIIRQGRWKLHKYFEDNGLELYDLATDIGEQFNLIDQEPEVAACLLALLQNWQAQTDAPIPTTKNPQFDPVAEREAIMKRLAREN